MLYIDEETQRVGQNEYSEGSWWTTPYGAWRLAAEIEAMNHFPQFRLESGGGMLVWNGTLVSGLDSGDSYQIRLTYPPSYPDEAPKIEIVAPELDAGTPHLLPLNKPCLYGYNGVENGYDPARTTAATLIAWTALWIHAYETWRQTDEWPGRGV